MPMGMGDPTRFDPDFQPKPGLSPRVRIICLACSAFCCLVLFALYVLWLYLSSR